MLLDLRNWRFDPTAEQLLQLLMLAKGGYGDRDSLLVMLNWDFEAKEKEAPSLALRARYGLTMLYLNKFRKTFSNGDILPRPAIDIWEALSGLIAAENRNETLEQGRERRRAEEQASVEVLAVLLIEVLSAEHGWLVKAAKEHVAKLLLQFQFWPRKGHVSKQGLPAVESWWKNKGNWRVGSDRKVRYKTARGELASGSAEQKVAALENVIRSCCMSRALARSWDEVTEA